MHGCKPYKPSSNTDMLNRAAALSDGFAETITAGLTALSTGFYTLQAAVFEAAVLPLLRALDLTAFSSAAFDGTEVFLLGAVQITLMYALLRPLERWRPAEAIEIAHERRTDVVYTVLHRMGGFALISFTLLTPVLDGGEAQLRLWGFNRLHLDSAAWLAASPLALFAAYFVLLDAVGYWIHRAQHRVVLWWQLHALHHANPSMSLWSDNRNHLLDDLLIDMLMVVVSWFIGIEPAQFVLWLFVSRWLQSLQHANVRLSFGTLGERLLVSPQFHRTHHAISSGFEGRARGCNFGVVLPWWDVLFGTAKFNAPQEPTGVRDTALGRRYGTGLWSQQGLGLLRLVGKA
jgi:sterol desaturase/sphingolipid hydroxylase (fatty acid hydroxylase superfamily)